MSKFTDELKACAGLLEYDADERMVFEAADIIDELERALRELTKASDEYAEAASSHFSDTTYDADGVLAQRDAELSVSAIPNARNVLTKLEQSA